MLPRVLFAIAVVFHTELELVPGAAVTKSQPPVIFMSTQVSHISSGGGDFRKLQ